MKTGEDRVTVICQKLTTMAAGGVACIGLKKLGK